MVSELNTPSHVQSLGCFFAGISLTKPTLRLWDQDNEINVYHGTCTYPVLDLVFGSSPAVVEAFCRTRTVLEQPYPLARTPLSPCRARILHSTDV